MKYTEPKGSFFVLQLQVHASGPVQEEEIKVARDRSIDHLSMHVQVLSIVFIVEKAE